MSFFVYDISFLAVFILFIIIFLYTKGKNVKRQGILFLYPTKVGIKFINSIAKKCKKILLSLRWIIISTGYLLMAGVIITFFQALYIFSKPELVKAIKIPPLTPLIPYLPQIFKIDFLPSFYFTYWIIVIAIVAVSHEFAHGIFARLAGVKIKSTGFGFLGPFLAAFVEPDEKKVNKASKKNQLAILSAGVFANILMTILFFFVLAVFFMLSFSQSGVIFYDYIYTPINISEINSIGNISLINPGFLELRGAIEKTAPQIQIENLSFVKINSNNQTYLLDTRIKDLNYSIIPAYDNLPAINSGLKGTIIEINEKKINNYEEFAKEINSKTPFEKINVKTRFNNEILNYNIELAENPSNSSKAVLGVAFLQEKKGFLREIISKAVFFKKPYTEYIPKYNTELALFLYNLIWWIVFVNFGVAIMNMLPLGVFDGGRVFYVTMLAIFRKEKTAKILYKFMTIFFLAIFVLLMIFWGFGIV